MRSKPGIRARRCEDGGKYKVKSLFHVTVVEGGVKTFTDDFDAWCIQMP